MATAYAQQRKMVYDQFKMGARTVPVGVSGTRWPVARRRVAAIRSALLQRL
jgi:hypothetical protein